jgi:5S rRNA maturation endonuclease (ribonuclease M5)
VNRYILILVTVDSAGQPMDERLMKDLKSMGQISINFHYVNNLRLSANQNLKPIPKKTIIKDVPEKALKGRALSHQLT